MLPLPNTNVRKKEIVAEAKPLFNAVKNAEAKILNPHIRNEMEYSFNPCRVSSKSFILYPTNRRISGLEATIAKIVITTPVVKDPAASSGASSLKRPKERGI